MFFLLTFFVIFFNCFGASSDFHVFECRSILLRLSPRASKDDLDSLGGWVLSVVGDTPSPKSSSEEEEEDSDCVIRSRDMARAVGTGGSVPTADEFWNPFAEFEEGEAI